MKTIERAKEIDKLNVQDVPYDVWVLFGDKCKQIYISGTDSVSLGEDFVDIKQVKKVIEWYAEQFNGAVKWKK